MITLLYLCLPLFTRVYSCLPMFSTVYLCLYTYVDLCLLVFTSVYTCLPMLKLQENKSTINPQRYYKQSSRHTAITKINHFIVATNMHSP